MRTEVVVVDVRVALAGNVLPFAVVQKVDVLVVLEFVEDTEVDLVHLQGSREVVLDYSGMESCTGSSGEAPGS